MAVLTFRSMNPNIPTSNDGYFGLRRNEYLQDSCNLTK